MTHAGVQSDSLVSNANSGCGGYRAQPAEKLQSPLWLHLGNKSLLKA